ncbi:hypothetical protein EDB92DRAFT_1817879 [Lactarius akahatsu]|uniref:Uncharacterized protein n=1 Tax=Lactarius akahatsu TaxID=416441 RepID=A0AAD4LE17_9AGAM|nr:hypothetical protein EDB92DRAFT_1817879 [Lactarius akahatsu]
MSIEGELKKYNVKDISLNGLASVYAKRTNSPSTHGERTKNMEDRSFLPDPHSPETLNPPTLSPAPCHATLAVRVATPIYLVARPPFPEAKQRHHVPSTPASPDTGSLQLIVRAVGASVPTLSIAPPFLSHQADTPTPSRALACETSWAEPQTFKGQTIPVQKRVADSVLDIHRRYGQIEGHELRKTKERESRILKLDCLFLNYFWGDEDQGADMKHTLYFDQESTFPHGERGRLKIEG